MSSTYSAADDQGALRKRAAELGARVHLARGSPGSSTLGSDLSSTAARRRLSRCYAALAATPRSPGWAAIKRLARFAETAAGAARASPDGEAPESLRREAAFVKAHVVLCEALYRCDLGACATAVCRCAAARAALLRQPRAPADGGGGGSSPTSGAGDAPRAARDFAKRAFDANLAKIPILFDVDAADAARDDDGAAAALVSALESITGRRPAWDIFKPLYLAQIELVFHDS